MLRFPIAVQSRTIPSGALALTLLVAAGAGACRGKSSSDRAPASHAAASGHTTGDSSAGALSSAFVTTAGPYRVRPLDSSGTVSGTVVVDGALPADSAIHPTVDAAYCGATVADGSLPHQGRSIGNAVVWIAGVRSGKALPIERRLEIVNSSCQLDPRVQAATAGSTVNVRNEDGLVHRTVFTRAGTHDTLGVFPFLTSGQVVPSTKLAAQPGMLDVTCAVHPWTRGHIAVFDHPYFAVTSANGAFRIDSLPPGRYRLVVWHEREDGGPQEQEVEVSAAKETKVEVRVKVR